MPHIFPLGLWLLLVACPCLGEDDPKVHEIGLEEQRIDVENLEYFIEPASLPLDIEKFKAFDKWKKDEKAFIFEYDEVQSKRVIFKFQLIINDYLKVYLENPSVFPLKYSRFLIFDETGNEIFTKELRGQAPLWSAQVRPGKITVLMIQEPKYLSSLKNVVQIMNEEYLNLVRMPERQIKSFIYGIGVSCIFFNLSMFLLLRTMYSLYYVIYSSSILYGLATGSSHIAMHQAIFWPLCLILAAWTAALLSNSVLNMQYFSPKLWRISVCLMSVSSLCVAVYFLFAFGPVLYISYFLALLSILMNVYAAFIRLFSGYVPAIFLGLGWSVLFFGYALTFIGLYVIHFPPITWSAFVAYAIESVLFAIALTYRTRDSEQKAIQDKMHALSQLQKVVYSHQVEQIKNGSELESTMPTTSAHACVLSFGIMNGSKIKHIKAKAFFRNVFSRCNAIMSEGYDGMNLKANAYRIKEMGNGFLCSVGYPFQSMSINPANDSIDLAKRFADVLAEEADMLHSEVPIVCGIGIVLDTLTGFYPEAGTKEYDLYGQAIFLATCYQDMHKALTEEAQGRSVLIIQEVVYQSLDSSYRTGFIPMDLRELGVEVRDDPAATRLYYQLLGSQKAGGSKSLLKVV